jgi:hypothetical protein
MTTRCRPLPFRHRAHSPTRCRIPLGTWIAAAPAERDTWRDFVVDIDDLEMPGTRPPNVGWCEYALDGDDEEISA